MTRNGNLRGLFLAVLTLAFWLLSLTGCAAKEDPTRLHLNGRLEAPTVDLAPKVAGRVVSVAVREGDRVAKDALLVTLDLGETGLAPERDRQAVGSAEARYEDLATGSRASEIAAAEAEVADRRAALDLARKEKERQEQLLAKKVGTPRDLDRAKTDLDRAAANARASEDRLRTVRDGSRKWQTEQARREIERAKAVLAQSTSVARESELRAPADAVVLHRMAEPGLLLSPGQPGLTLAFQNRLYVRTFIPETKLGRVKPGMKAEVFVDAFPGRAFPGTLVEISPDAEFTPKPVETKAERINLVYAAKVDLDNGWKEPLVPGQPAEVVLKIVE
ncbi:MAG: efflux RND transporter periplasmic adaptor subunit [Acidobacteria bacterium]|nr:efflux RND transporter periplasmic adaptor subunit [Acidobacteriota bacterium]